MRTYRWGRGDIVGSIGFAASDNDGITGVAGDATGFGEDLQQGNLAIHLVNHRVHDGTNYSNGLAFLLFDENADLGVGNQAIGFQNFGDLQFCLKFGEPGDVQAHGHEGNTDGACLADTSVAAQLLNVKDLNGKKIASPYDIVASRRGPHGSPSRKGADAIVDLLRSLYGLRAAG